VRRQRRGARVLRQPQKDIVNPQTTLLDFGD